VENTNTAQVATPAPAPATTTDPKAGDTTTGATTEQPKNDVTSTENGSRDNLPKGVKRRIWEQAERIRAMEAELATLKKPAEVVTKSESEPELLDNPQAWAENVKRSAAESAKQQALSQIKEEQEAERLKTDHAKGMEYLFSQTEVSNSDDAQAEITEILRRSDMQHLASKYPSRAAELAFKEWKDSKGIGSDRKAAAAQNAQSSISTATTPPPSAGRKTWTRAEVTKYLADYNAPDFATRNAEIKQAYREGRIK
jgi:hypothetical protein